MDQSSLAISLTNFEAVKELYKVHFPISVYTSIGRKEIIIINFGRRTDLHLIFVGR